MDDRRPSGLPRDRVFPGAPGFDYDYESDVAEASVLIRNLRRTMLAASSGVAILLVVFLIDDNGDAARGVINLLGVPILFIVLVTEVMAFFHRRRTRGSDHADG